MNSDRGAILLDTCALIWLAAGTDLKTDTVDLITEAAISGNAIVAAA
jgi:PIN domain nuclease of toxin-antitoxin system